MRSYLFLENFLTFIDKNQNRAGPGRNVPNISGVLVLVCKSETQNYVKRVSGEYMYIAEYAFPPTGLGVAWFSCIYFAFVICKELVLFLFFLPSLFLSFARLDSITVNAQYQRK